jgi:hypothetical protein
VFMRGHVLHHLDACRGEIGARIADEIIIDHPLGKGLVHYGCGIGAAGEVGNAGNVRRGGGRYVAIGASPVYPCAAPTRAMRCRGRAGGIRRSRLHLRASRRAGSVF